MRVKAQAESTNNFEIQEFCKIISMILNGWINANFEFAIVCFYIVTVTED